MSLLLQCVLILCISVLCQSYMTSLSRGAVNQRMRRRPSCVLSLSNNNGDDYYIDSSEDIGINDVEHRKNDNISRSSTISRRKVLGSSLLAIAGGSILAPPSLSVRAIGSEDEDADSSFDVNCLQDLPPIQNGFVRVYLCRHGQTENNRLKLMQGARVDPSINDNGMVQATRLGMALANAGAAPPAMIPDTILHSKLLRARQTAQLASQQFEKQQLLQKPKLALLESLGEVDFGALAEGFPVEQVRSELVATYTGWANGNLDIGLEGGETGRQVLDRVENALGSLVQQAAKSESQCVAAVAHSTYLRMLLAVAQEQPLLLASTVGQKNCCVNVLDLKADGSTKAIGPRSRLFTGGPLLSKAPSDFRLTIPQCKVVRINEKRHLGNLA